MMTAETIPMVFGALPLVGAAIFRIKESVTKNRAVILETVQLGRNNALAIQEQVGGDIYVAVPTGSITHIQLTPDHLVVGLDYRAKPHRDLLSKIHIAEGPSRSQSKVIDSISDGQVHEDVCPGVSVRYLGETNNRELKRTPLKTLFERGMAAKESASQA